MFCWIVLYSNLSRMPSLLPNKRNEEQTRQAYKMLSDCFRLTSNHLFQCLRFLTFLDIVLYYTFFMLCRYAIRTSRCRAQMLVQYFGEDFAYDSCHSYVKFFPMRNYFKNINAWKLWQIWLRGFWLLLILINLND